MAIIVFFILHLFIQVICHSDLGAYFSTKTTFSLIWHQGQQQPFSVDTVSAVQLISTQLHHWVWLLHDVSGYGPCCFWRDACAKDACVGALCLFSVPTPKKDNKLKSNETNRAVDGVHMILLFFWGKFLLSLDLQLHRKWCTLCTARWSQSTFSDAA